MELASPARFEQAPVVARAMAGDVAAFEALYRLHVGRIHRTAHLARDGAVEVEIACGTLQVKGVEGDAPHLTVSGNIGIVGARGEVSVETVSGDVAVRGDLALPAVAADSVSGSIDLAVELAPGGQLEANSHSGKVAVHLPADTDAVFERSSFTGTVENHLAGGKREFTVGAGRGRVRVDTFSGPVEVGPPLPPPPPPPPPPSGAPPPPPPPPR